MQSLTSLVRHADPGDPLAQVVCSLIDSGLIVTTRDGRGRYVQLSETYGRELALGVGLESRGSTFTDGFEFFDANGRPMAMMEHPAQVTRLTGEPQRLRLTGVRGPTGYEAWTINSYMPLGRDEDGYQVLTVGVSLPRSVFQPPTAEDEGMPRSFQQALLDFALAVSGQHLGEDALIETMWPAVSEIVDAPLSVALVLAREGFMHVKPIVRFSEAPPPPPMRISGASALRWRMTETYYNPNMGDADVLGDRIVIEFPTPIRSYALVPMFDGEGRRVGAISLTAPVPHAMSPHQRCALEQLARLAGPVLVPPEGQCHGEPEDVPITVK